jgi:hypothetical protein
VACAAAALPSQEIGVDVTFARTVYVANSTSVVRHQPELAFNFKSLRVLIAFPAITAAFHVGYALLVPAAGAEGNPWRWLEYSITATLLTATAAVDSGVDDQDAFAFLIALSVGMQACGLGLDLLPRSPPPRGARETFLGVGFLAVVTILWRIISHTTSELRPPGAPSISRRVSVAYGVYYLSFGAAATLRAYDAWLWRSPAWTEFAYVVLSVSSKTSVFWLSFAGIKDMINYLEPSRQDTSASWSAVQTAAEVLPALGAATALAAAAALGLRAKHPPRGGNGGDGATFSKQFFQATNRVEKSNFML